VYDDVGAFFVSILKPSQAWQKAFFWCGSGACQLIFLIRCLDTFSA
jgi:hypothetical protein